MSLLPNLPHTVTEDHESESSISSVPMTSANHHNNAQSTGTNLLTLPISPPIASSPNNSSTTSATTAAISNGSGLNSWSGRQMMNGSSPLPHVAITVTDVAAATTTTTVPDDLAISMIRHHHDADEHEEEVEEEEDEAEIFDSMTNAQMRMGAIFGQGGEDSGEMMQMRSDNSQRTHTQMTHRRNIGDKRRTMQIHAKHRYSHT